MRRTIVNQFGKNNLPTASLPLISTDELSQNLSDVKLLDVSWLKLPLHAHRDPVKEFAERRIPGAQYFDIDTHCDRDTKFPHMLPSPKHFAEVAKQYDLSKDHHIVCYDSLGVFSAPRVWWTLKAFGFENVSVLDGGLKKWLAEGRAVESGEKVATPSTTSAILPSLSLNTNLVATYPKVKDAVNQLMKGRHVTSIQILDARNEARFRGEAAEPWPVPSGHMLGATNTPFAELINGETGCYHPVDKLRSKLLAFGYNPAVPAIFTCGSGVTACIPFTAVEIVRAADKAAVESGEAKVDENGKFVGTTTQSFYIPSTPSFSNCVFDGAWIEWCTREAEAAEADMNNFYTEKHPNNPTPLAPGGPVSLLNASGKQQRSIEGIGAITGGGPVKLDVASRNLGLSLSRSRVGAVGPVKLTEASPSMSASKGGVLFESSDEDSDSEDREPLALRLSRSKEGSLDLNKSTSMVNRRTGQKGL